MKKQIQQYWDDMFTAINTQDATLITRHFAPKATYRCRLATEMMSIPVNDMAGSCLGYKDTLDGKHNIDRIEELANGTWISIITASVNSKPYFTTSFFTFKNSQITDLTEYYGDFE